MKKSQELAEELLKLREKFDKKDKGHFSELFSLSRNMERNVISLADTKDELTITISQLHNTIADLQAKIEVFEDKDWKLKAPIRKAKQREEDCEEKEELNRENDLTNQENANKLALREANIENKIDEVKRKMAEEHLSNIQDLFKLVNGNLQNNNQDKIIDDMRVREGIPVESKRDKEIERHENGLRMRDENGFPQYPNY